MNISVVKIDNAKLENLRLRTPEYLELVDCTDGKKVRKPAGVSLSWSEDFLFVDFLVDDDHIWGTYTHDNDPIYNEEAVEIFIAFGKDDSKEYWELQFSPNAVKYCAKVYNPTGDRSDVKFEVKAGIEIDGLEFLQNVDVKSQNENFKTGFWRTIIKIPAQAIKGGAFTPADLLRANFYRIDGYPKQNSFQALSPNFVKPANFHVPNKFLKMELS